MKKETTSKSDMYINRSAVDVVYILFYWICSCKGDTLVLTGNLTCTWPVDGNIALLILAQRYPSYRLAHVGESLCPAFHCDRLMMTPMCEVLFQSVNESVWKSVQPDSYPNFTPVMVEYVLQILMALTTEVPHLKSNPFF